MTRSRQNSMACCNAVHPGSLRSLGPVCRFVAWPLRITHSHAANGVIGCLVRQRHSSCVRISVAFEADAAAPWRKWPRNSAIPA